jgi:cellobiose phosphorylase
MRSVVEIPPGTDLEVDYFLGSAPNAATAAAAVRKLREAGSVSTALAATNGWWDQTLASITVQTPDRAVDVLFNHWLLHQVISSRVWGRTGYYQSSGAFGYRDQLQDSLALVYSRPEITREVIIEAARHQYKEGDTQHWWMPGTARGLRTRMTDDRMWLPYVVANYVTVTGDTALLDERVPYLEGGMLPPGMMEDYHEASVSAEDGTIMDHCYRAIAISMTQGAHGLPLMGAGDWNDGLNRVGIGGQGESVWLGWFQVVVLREMADLLDHLGRSPRRATQYRDQAEIYTKAIDKNAWDGGWYLRAFYDDGVPMGSAKNAEGRIDSIPQSWAVIAGTGQPERQALAMEAAVHQLVDHEAGIVNLLTPAFDKSDRDPGYIKGYLPGTRENGGQYTHASLWVALALARMGRGDDAVEILQLLNPINHTLTKEQADRYVLEPYVLAGDVYSLAGHTGRGGWSWYTGSAAWTYRVWLEEVFGFKLKGKQLTIDPCIDRNWPGFTLTYRYRTATYIIEVTNPHHICRGVAEQTLDGQLHALGAIKLVDDGATHRILVRLGH